MSKGGTHVLDEGKTSARSGRDRAEAKKPETVSSRILSRQAAALLDHMELDGRAFLITRHGRPVALLSPVEGAPPVNDRLRRRLGLPAGAFVPGESLPDDDDGGGGDGEVRKVPLDATARRILMAVADAAPSPCIPPVLDGDAPAWARALGRMELDGFLIRDGSAYLLTPAGARLASRHRFEGS